MRNFKARLKKLEAKKPPIKRVVRIYWANGTFVGEMVYWIVIVLKGKKNIQSQSKVSLNVSLKKQKAQRISAKPLY